MRNAFASVMTELAASDEKLILLSGDIGNRLFNPFKEKFPDRFYNCGVAEADMTGIAAGFALSGFRPVTYTIASFNTFRCYEQIKIDLCYQNLPVVIAGVGAGLSYAELGGTHHSCEDIAVMRALPGMTVLCPGDAMEVKACLKAVLRRGGPAYLRLGKKNEPVIHESEPEILIGKAMEIRQGSDVCIISTGNILPCALAASEILEKSGLSTSLVSMHTVKPLDLDFLKAAFGKYKIVATVEEHSIIGGLGSAVAEWLLDGDFRQDKSRLLRFALPDSFHKSCGSQKEARKRFGLDGESIASKILDAIRK